MKVLVTGGAGFIGRHVVQRLLDRGDDVTVLDSFDAQAHDGRPPAWAGHVRLLHDGTAPAWVDHVRLLVGDVGDAGAADVALGGVDRVVHLAAVVGVGQSMYQIERYVRRNTLATATLLERVVAHGGIRRLVVASSMSVYGEGLAACARHGFVPVAPGARDPDDLRAHRWEPRCPACGDPLAPLPTSEAKALLPGSVYAITKRDQEELSLTVGAAYDIPTVALRFFNVYGPGQSLSNPYTGAAAIFASRILNILRPFVYEDGLQTRDFVHVSDVASAVLLALDSDATGPINVGTGEATTILRLASVLAEHLGHPEIAPFVPLTGRVGDVRHCVADTSRARRLLGFVAEIDVGDGLRELAAQTAAGARPSSSHAAHLDLVARGLIR